MGDGDEAEYRQSVGQQYLANYPGVGLYGNGYQYVGNGGSTGSSYGNMLRQLYRPPSFGLTDKVRSWVKSFLNRRQYVKPFYTPAMTSLAYTTDDLSGKPVYVAGASYKPVAVPLRQIQKYYKPFYSGSDAAQSQFTSTGGQRAAAGSPGTSGITSYSVIPSTSGSSATLGSTDSAASGVYAVNSASNNALYAALANSGTSGSLFGSTGTSNSGLFGSSTDGKAIFGTGNRGVLYGSNGGASGNSYFTAGGNSQLDSMYLPNAASGSSGLYGSSGGVDAGSLYSTSGSNNAELFSSASNSGYYLSNGNNGGLYSSGGSSSGLFSSGGGNSGSVSNGALYAASLGGGNSYIPSGSAESSATYAVDSAYDASVPYASESSYSVSYQRPQSKSYSASASDNKSSFQPVNFGTDSASQSSSSVYSEKKA